MTPLALLLVMLMVTAVAHGQSAGVEPATPAFEAVSVKENVGRETTGPRMVPPTKEDEAWARSALGL